MRVAPAILFALLLSLAAPARGQQTANAIAYSGFAVGVDTYFDFGPPFAYYEIFVVVPTKEGSKVEKFTLTPPAHKCYAPAKTEYVEKTSTRTIEELLAGEDPCKIREKDLKKERKRRTKELNFSGAEIALQITCDGRTQTIETRVLERDWFLAHPGTPKNTSWTLELLSKLRSLTGPGAMEKPVFAMAETEPAAPLSADPATLEKLASGKYDSLFQGTTDKASEIYRASLVPPFKPSVTLISSTPMEPVHFTLPAYPRLPWLVAQEGEPSVVVRIDSQGNVSEVKTYMGSKLFEGTVRDTVKNWKFPPAPSTTEIIAPPREVTVSFSFQLNCPADAEKK